MRRGRFWLSLKATFFSSSEIELSLSFPFRNRTTKLLQNVHIAKNLSPPSKRVIPFLVPRGLWGVGTKSLLRKPASRETRLPNHITSSQLPWLYMGSKGKKTWSPSMFHVFFKESQKDGIWSVGKSRDREQTADYFLSLHC